MKLALLAALAGAAAAFRLGARPGHGIAGLSNEELFPADMHPRTRAAHRRMMSRWTTAPVRAASERVLKPADFGADPTCTVDSTAAFANLTSVLITMNVTYMADGIKDLGGAVVDLDGGCYLISAPLAIPQFVGDFHIERGELRATPNFPANESLIVVGGGLCNPPSGQGSCNQNAGFHSLTLDASHVAASCLTIHSTMGAVLDGSSAIFGFTTAGIVLAGGHETMISNTWLAAYFWNSHFKEHNNATGVLVNGNDHYVSDSIVYSAQIGVMLNGAANILNGVHTWNCATANGGVGVVNRMSQNRIVGGYYDFTDLVLSGSGAQQTLIQDSFFLGGAQLVFEAGSGNGQNQVYGVALSGNAWYDTGSAPFAVNETFAKWAGITDLTVVGTVLQQGQPFNGPAAVQVASNLPVGTNDTWTFDFSSQLLFPSVPIADVKVQLLGDLSNGAAVTSTGGAVIGAADPANPLSVTVYAPGTAGGAYSLRVTVDQSSTTASKTVPAKGW